MNLSNYYYFIKSALPSRICDLIVKQGTEQKEGIAITGAEEKNKYRDIKKNPLNEKELFNLKKKRDSNVVWLDDRWIYKEIHPFIREANQQAGWNFNWDRSESCQFTIYKEGQYYDWHQDSWDKPYEKKGPENGLIRKLSVTVSLTDPKNYQGGELEFDLRNQDPERARNTKLCTEILPKGSIVVFPSFVWHRVKPITKGIRYSLVIWNLGKPYK
jgi:PKHD-type hydroxylase